MQLRLAERADFIQIAKDVYDLWSAGLTRDSHRYFLNCAYYQPWSKRNHFRLVGKDEDKVAASCKVVQLPLAHRGTHFKILGLGAIFTSIEYRGQGLATNLVESIIDKSRQEKVDGILLFSDIDRRFYADCGFVDLGNLDVEIDNSFYSISDHVFTASHGDWATTNNSQIENRYIHVGAQTEPRFHFSSFSPWLEDLEIREVVACYSRWLARQPYGIVRTHNYFTFQLARHIFIANYSKNNKPKLCFTILKDKQTIVGYAICEHSKDHLRILEVIGSDAARAQLWHNLIEQAQQIGLRRSCGFESISRDFVPYQRLEEDRLALKPTIKPSQIKCYERSWGQPMFLSLNTALDELPDYNPCPILEFDYF